MIQAYERLGRRLMEHHRKQLAAVGVRHGGWTIRLFVQWDERLGRLRVCHLRRGAAWGIDLHQTRELARSVLGKQAAIVAGEMMDADCGGVAYVLAMDAAAGVALGGAPGVFGLDRPAAVRLPAAVRWFKAELLAAGIGQQDNGYMTFRGTRLIPVLE